MTPDSRQALIAAAKKIFALKGFDAATVKDIADEAKLNVSLVSYYFGGKEALYRVCLEEFGKKKLAQAERFLRPPASREDFLVRMRIYAEEFIATHNVDPEVAEILLRECSMHNPVSEEFFENTLLKSFMAMVEFVKSARSAGIVRKEIDPLLASALFLGGLVHLLRNAKLTEKHFKIFLNDPKASKKVIDQVMALFENGVLS